MKNINTKDLLELAIADHRAAMKAGDKDRTAMTADFVAAIVAKRVRDGS